MDYIIRKLNSTEIFNLKEELDSNNDMWSPHIPNLDHTALKDGKSIHLQWCNDDCKINYIKWDIFPKTHALLKNIVGDKPLGRVYWHRLLPGENIIPHTDASLPYIKSGKFQYRYQIYLDIDKDIKIFFGNQIVDGNFISNTIVEFPLKTLHYYKNNSSSTLYLLVFDELVPSTGYDPVNHPYQGCIIPFN